MKTEQIVLIKQETRLEKLIQKFNTFSQAKFYIEQNGGSFQDYVQEHEVYHSGLESIVSSVQGLMKMKVLERRYLPTNLFAKSDLIVVYGQDGLVANTAKYVNGLPIIAVNPDPQRYDGILLPFSAGDFHSAVIKVAEQKAIARQVCMGEATLNDGQKLLAFNDFFIGASSHVSARYQITNQSRTERQSSSGVLVSTGAGSTGWLSSVFNMVQGINLLHGRPKEERVNLSWETAELFFVVREPFRSRWSDASLTAGKIAADDNLQLESLMPDGGVIFSDGIEADFLSFNAGGKVKIGVAKEKAILVQKG